MCEDGFVAEDAVEGRAADAELARRAQFVPVVEVEHILHVVMDHGVEARFSVAAAALRGVGRSGYQTG